MIINISSRTLLYTHTVMYVHTYISLHALYYSRVSLRNVMDYLKNWKSKLPCARQSISNCIGSCQGMNNVITFSCLFVYCIAQKCGREISIFKKYIYNDILITKKCIHTQQHVQIYLIDCILQYLSIETFQQQQKVEIIIIIMKLKLKPRVLLMCCYSFTHSPL